MKHALVVTFCLLILLMGRETLAQTATNTPTRTPTITPTPNNAERAGMETIVPPASCGNIYNPCSALPWAVPVLPTVALPSPTLMMVMADIGTTPVPGGTPTLTPTHTATSVLIDTEPIATMSAAISDVSGTLYAMSAATVEVNGTEQSVTGLGAQLSTNMPSVFGTVRGVLAATNNKAMGVVSFLFLAFLFVLLVYLLTLAFPVVLRVVEFVLRVITAVKPF